MNSASLLERVERLNRIGMALSSEPDTDRLLELILRSARELTGADGGTLYLVRDNDTIEFAIMSTDSLGIELGGTTGREIPFDPLPLRIDGEPNRSMVVTNSVLQNRTINIRDAYHAEGYDFSGTRAFDRQTGYRTQALLTVPMTDHEDSVIGVLQLINPLGPDGNIIPFSRESQQLAESLGSQAAIALTNKRLVDDLANLFKSFVRMIAGAIDEKSPYTGAHCRRVPELTMLLADAAHRHTRGPLASFRLDGDERHALEIAAWLHDCGKITTPEHVMDKATKLSTVHDRIDTIAARFAALRAGIEADYASRLRDADGPQRTVIEGERDRVLGGLDSDLAFLRQANVGAEAMSGEDKARVREIAAREWTDATGKPRSLLTEDEVANLLVERGTLTQEERKVIENHAAVTIRMLEQLPFPRHLRNVPEYAGGHHERVDGKGYPNGLTREQMSIPARVMAIADIFEALSAGDRPYKKAKTLSQCLQILGYMRLEGHIDPDLFDVFIDEGVYRAYAERYLRPDQIDEVEPESIPGYTPPEQRSASPA